MPRMLSSWGDPPARQISNKGHSDTPLPFLVECISLLLFRPANPIPLSKSNKNFIKTSSGVDLQPNPPIKLTCLPV